MRAKYFVDTFSCVSRVFLPMHDLPRRSTRKIVPARIGRSPSRDFERGWTICRKFRTLGSRSGRPDFRWPIRTIAKPSCQDRSYFPILFFLLFFTYFRAFPSPVPPVMPSLLKCFSSFLVQLSPSSSLRILLMMSGSKLNPKFTHIQHARARTCVRACLR